MNTLERVQKSVASSGFDALIVSSEANRFFASGFASSAGVVFVTAEKSWLLTDFRYIEAAKRSVQNAEALLVSREQKYAELLNGLIAESAVKSVMYEDLTVTAAELEQYKKDIAAPLSPAGKLLGFLRAEKQDFELEAMRAAQRMTDGVFSAVLGKIKPGMTEKQLEAELIYEIYKAGADKPSFDPIVVSGPNSSLPHGKAGQRVIERGDFVTMDFGVCHNGYVSDMTRTVAVGAASGRMREIYEIVLEAQLLGLERARAGVPWREVDGAVRSFIAGKGYGENFGHGLGHGLGVEVHEGLDFSADKPGVTPVNGVVSVEPGIYLPGEFGVRIEDCVILKEDGNENMAVSDKRLLII